MSEKIWQQFQEKEGLTDQQVELFERYGMMLRIWNKKINLTTIDDMPGIIAYHFKDSLALSKAVNIDAIHTIADVGTGAGFPGLALKIKYPHLRVLLIEVVQKKINFLQAVIDELGLENVEIFALDWRTFLRTTNYPVDIFCARASLQLSELFRMFKPSSPYLNADLVYWASKNWEVAPGEEKYLKEVISYHVGKKERQLAVFSR
jgi:16S rRNA (guanine527-N7)-methyltransferase